MNRLRRLSGRMIIRQYEQQDIPGMIPVWNEVVEEGVAFPQEEMLTEETGRLFFEEQTYSAVAVDDTGKICGLYYISSIRII